MIQFFNEFFCNFLNYWNKWTDYPIKEDSDFLVLNNKHLWKSTFKYTVYLKKTKQNIYCSRILQTKKLKGNFFTTHQTPV